MWERHAKGTRPTPPARRVVIASTDGKLSISATLMAELGSPDRVDLYADRERQTIGITGGDDYGIGGCNGSAGSGGICASGVLSVMGVAPDQRVARPKFEMTRHEGRPMLVIWPLVSVYGPDDTAASTPDPAASASVDA